MVGCPPHAAFGGFSRTAQTSGIVLCAAVQWQVPARGGKDASMGCALIAGMWEAFVGRRSCEAGEAAGAIRRGVREEGGHGAVHDVGGGVGRGGGAFAGGRAARSGAAREGRGAAAGVRPALRHARPPGVSRRSDGAGRLRRARRRRAAPSHGDPRRQRRAHLARAHGRLRVVPVLRGVHPRRGARRCGVEPVRARAPRVGTRAGPLRRQPVCRAHDGRGGNRPCRRKDGGHAHRRGRVVSRRRWLG